MKRHLLCLLLVCFSWSIYAQLDLQLVSLKDALTNLAAVLKGEKTGPSENGNPPPPPPPPVEQVCTIPKKTFELQAFTPESISQEEREASDAYVLKIVADLGMPVSKDIVSVMNRYTDTLKKLTMREAYNAGFRLPALNNQEKPLISFKKNSTSIVDTYRTLFAKKESEKFEKYLARMQEALENIDTIADAYNDLVFDATAFRQAAGQHLVQSAINLIAAYRQGQIQQEADNKLLSDNTFVAAFNTSNSIEQLLHALYLLRIDPNYRKYANLESDIAHTDISSLSISDQLFSQIKSKQLDARSSIFFVVRNLNMYKIEEITAAQNFLEKYLFVYQKFGQVTKLTALQSDAKRQATFKTTAYKKKTISLDEFILIAQDFQSVLELCTNKDVSDMQKADIAVTVPVANKLQRIQVALPAEKTAREKLIKLVKVIKPYNSIWIKAFVCDFSELLSDDAKKHFESLSQVYLQKIEQDAVLMKHIEAAQSSAEFYTKLASDVDNKDDWMPLLDELASPYRTPGSVIEMVLQHIRNKNLLAVNEAHDLRLKKIIEPYGMLMRLFVLYADLIAYKITNRNLDWDIFFANVTKALQGIAAGKELTQAEVAEVGDIVAELSRLKTMWASSDETYTAATLKDLIDGLTERDSNKIRAAVTKFIDTVNINQLKNNAQPYLATIDTAFTQAILQEVRWELQMLQDNKKDLIPGLSYKDQELLDRNINVYQALASLVSEESNGITSVLKNSTITQQDVTQLQDLFKKILVGLPKKLEDLKINPDDVMPLLQNYFDAKVAIVKNCIA